VDLRVADQKVADAVDHKTSAALEFSDHCGGARPVDAVDHQV